MDQELNTKLEWLKCKQSAVYFIHTYCKIYDATEGVWFSFVLWPKQVEVLQDLKDNRLVVALKARQLGMTWLVLCFILWKMLFYPSFTALVFSRREVEAIYLLGDDRLRGIYNRLPKWLQAREIVTDSSHIFQLSNGSVAYGFPTSAGDSYTASFAFVDEADLVPDLQFLMNGVKPTIDGGGGMVLLSRIDKNKPNSLFRKTYLGARAGVNGWKAIFLPWYVRPDRNEVWYQAQKNDILSRTGSLDDLFQQYPATDEEALLPPTINRRLKFEWITQCVAEAPSLEAVELDIPNLIVWKKPDSLGLYVIPNDPAEGNPTSDDSVAMVFDVNTGEQVALFAGKIEPSLFTSYLVTLSIWYNNALILPERNNHGHAVILSLDETYATTAMPGWDDKPGWLSTSRGKALMYAAAAERLRDRETIIHDSTTVTQLASIEGSTLRAPEGNSDDYATTFCLGMAALTLTGGVVETGDNPTEGWRG